MKKIRPGAFKSPSVVILRVSVNPEIQRFLQKSNGIRSSLDKIMEKSGIKSWRSYEN